MLGCLGLFGVFFHSQPVFMVVCPMSMIPVSMYRASRGVEVGTRRILFIILSRIRFCSVFSFFVGFLVSPA